MGRVFLLFYRSFRSFDECWRFCVVGDRDKSALFFWLFGNEGG